MNKVDNILWFSGNAISESLDVLSDCISWNFTVSRDVRSFQTASHSPAHPAAPARSIHNSRWDSMRCRAWCWEGMPVKEKILVSACLYEQLLKCLWSENRKKCGIKKKRQLPSICAPLFLSLKTHARSLSLSFVFLARSSTFSLEGQCVCVCVWMKARSHGNW